MVAARSGVNSNLPKGSVVSGFPTIPHKDWLKASTIFGKLPKIYRDLRDLKKKIEKIYDKLFPDEEKNNI
ncbi:MAG: hypothetical protein JRF02_04635 [Deltaproteobacteria bacterium]|jgi:UDP-3-O-[3-hydroxymyristoyl] glucosamine N-acyltransferase|nr:hypothetical protein [Deltaproteobacteria bacterium]